MLSRIFRRASPVNKQWCPVDKRCKALLHCLAAWGPQASLLKHEHRNSEGNVKRSRAAQLGNFARQLQPLPDVACRPAARSAALAEPHETYFADRNLTGDARLEFLRNSARRLKICVSALSARASRLSTYKLNLMNLLDAREAMTVGCKPTMNLPFT